MPVSVVCVSYTECQVLGHWYVFFCFIYTECQGLAWAVVSLTLSVKCWSKFLCFSYNESEVLDYVLVFLCVPTTLGHTKSYCYMQLWSRIGGHVIVVDDIKEATFSLASSKLCRIIMMKLLNLLVYSLLFDAGMQ